MGIKVEGTQEIVDMLLGSREQLQRDVPPVMQEWANTITIYARHNHAYTTRTGNAERATTNRVDPSTLSMRIFLDDQLTTVGGYNYPELLHNGTKHITADPFLYRANDIFESEAVTSIQEAVWQSLTRRA